MSTPPAPYLRLSSFTGYSPYRDASLGVSMDNEFNAIQVVVNALETRLALIQRADGNLLSGSVGPDQLGSGLTAQSISVLSSFGANAINTAPNILTVGGPSALFSSKGTTGTNTDFRLTISKADATNTASVLFQDNFSGRAEIGLTGDDNFHFKVSSDGNTFVDALDINTAGIVTALTPVATDNSTRLATTAFVAANFVPKLSPIFTGTLTAPAIVINAANTTLLTVGNGASGGSATPSSLAFDQTFSSTAGLGPKLTLITGYGLGVSANSFDHMAPTGAAHSFYVNAVSIASLSATAASITAPLTLAGAAVLSSSLSVAGAVSGAGVTSLFASPPSIGNTVAASGAFTTLTASTSLMATGAGTGLAVTNKLTAGSLSLGSYLSTFQAFGALGLSAVVTITIATPGVVTWMSHGLAAGQTIVFQTTGALPTGIVIATTYFVLATGLTANTFQFSLSSGGAAVNTSGTQSGVQTGLTDDTAAIQTALNSGTPILGGGQFIINSLVTITNKNVNVQGTSEGCTLILNSPQAMIYATLLGADIYLTNHITFIDVKFSINAVITSVTGPAKTAALFIYYPLGTSGITLQTVTIKNCQVKPTAAANYILNGIYLYDATNAFITEYLYEGRRSSIDINSSAIVYDGVASPTTLHVERLYAFFVGKGVNVVGHATLSWQGVRISNIDVVFCNYIVYAVGGADGKSDYISLSGVQGAFVTYGIYIQDATHAIVRDNYVFCSPGTGLTNAAFPIGIVYSWTLTIPAYQGASINGNTVDLNQAVGFTGRYGWQIGGTSGISVNTVVGPNAISNADVGFAILANTAGVVVLPQSTKNVATYSSITATAFVNTIMGVQALGVFNFQSTVHTPVTIANLPAAPVSGQLAYVHDTVGNLAPAYHAVVAAAGAVTVDGYVYRDATTSQWKWA